MNLLSGNISGLIMKIAYPTMIGMFFNTMFNVVDTYYVGKFSTDALAGMSVSFPLFLILIAFSFGFSSGPTSLIAAAYGKGNPDEAHKITAQTLLLGVGLMFFMIFLGLFASEPILRLIGADGEVLRDALLYIVPLLTLGSFQVFVPLLNAPLAANGFTKYFGQMLVLGFFLNLILDPMFIYGFLFIPSFGVKGVAYATITVQFLSLLFLAYQCVRLGLVDCKFLIRTKPDFRLMARIINQGLPPTANILMICVFFFVIQYFLVKYSVATLAAYGIGLRIEQIILIPGIGLNSAILAIGAQNFGAGNFDRLLRTRILGLYFQMIILISGSILLFFFGKYVFAFFTEDQAVIKIGLSYLMVESLVLPAYGFFNVYSSIMQAIQKPHISMFGGLTRHIFLPAILLPLFYFTLSVDNSNIWWVIFISNWIVATGMILYCEHLLKKTAQGRLTPAV